jgi:hypothetical protein
VAVRLVRHFGAGRHAERTGSWDPQGGAAPVTRSPSRRPPSAAHPGRPGRGRTAAPRRPRARRPQIARARLAPDRPAHGLPPSGRWPRRSDRRSGRGGSVGPGRQGPRDRHHGARIEMRTPRDTDPRPVPNPRRSPHREPVRTARARHDAGRPVRTRGMTPATGRDRKKAKRHRFHHLSILRILRQRLGMSP